MNTIPNNAHNITPKKMTEEEVREYIIKGDYVWVEFRHPPFSFEGVTLEEDDVFYLRISYLYGSKVEFATPIGHVTCDMGNYNVSWRIWNLCPKCGNDEPWDNSLWEEMGLV